MREYHTNTTVHFVLTMTKEGMASAESEGLLKFFKCTSTLNTTNMMAFDHNSKLRKYTSPEEIIEEWFPLRLSFYQKRKVNTNTETRFAESHCSLRISFATNSVINGTDSRTRLASSK